MEGPLGPTLMVSRLLSALLCNHSPSEARTFWKDLTFLWIRRDIKQEVLARSHFHFPLTGNSLE